MPPDLVPQGLWETPILIGSQTLDGFSRRDSLILYQLSMKPPPFVTNTASPEIELKADLGGIILQGADLSNQTVESGSLIHIVLYWNPSEENHFQVTTRLGEEVLETHTLGFGNLDRYREEIGPLPGNTIVEDYSIVIPSTSIEGMHPLTVGIQGSEKEAVIEDVTVINEEETMERWLRIAGKSQ